MIRECGRLDIKNPYEDLTSNEGFSFTKLAVDQLVQHSTGDVNMNDESQQPDQLQQEERKGPNGSTMLIDTTANNNAR